MGKLKWGAIIFLCILSIMSVKRYEDHLFDSILSAKTQKTKAQIVVSPTRSIHDSATASSSIFVPYWSVDEINDSSYDRLLYFGVTPGDKGINKDEEGYKNLSTFVEKNKDQKKDLVIRMTRSTENFTLIEDSKKSEALINDAISIAKNNGFDGVVLDLEVSALPFDSVIKNISNFVEKFYSKAKKNDLHFSITMYGDTFYRVRPFDMKTIGQNTDEVMIMAYDFSKAQGNPGPNFPLLGKNTFGYDFETMIGQFLQVIPSQKLTVIFGMFGYDWPVDEKGMATSGASSLTENQLKQKFVSRCSFKDCVVARDSVSSETKVTYTDSDGKKHIVWFEDRESVDKKREFLKTRGVEATSYWAYSYF